MDMAVTPNDKKVKTDVVFHTIPSILERCLTFPSFLCHSFYSPHYYLCSKIDLY